MVYYLVKQPLPRVGDTSYKPGDLIPADTYGLKNGLAIGLIEECPGEPPDELILEEVEGSGKSERVTKADVEEAAEEKAEKPKSRSRSKKSE